MSFNFTIFSEDVVCSIERQNLACGEVLFEIGQPADSFFYCEQGCVRMEVFPEPPKPMVFYRARAGNAFAEEHIGLDHYSYRAVADEDSIIQRVDRRLVLNDIRADPAIAQRLVFCLAKHNFQLKAIFERLGIRSAQDRVFHLLQSLVVQDDQPLDLTGKIKSLSDDLNLSREAMYRALKKLEDSGEITRNKGLIELKDEKEM